MKKIYKILSVLLCLVVLAGTLIACNDSETASAEEFSYVSMRINPEIELVVDAENKVVAVNAINEDGETVLAEVTLVGLTVEEAGEAFTAMATELGFLDVDALEAHVYILVDGENEEKVNEIKDKLNKKINKFFDNKGIFGKVCEEELEKLNALATEWNVSVKEAKLISRILELYPEMTVEEVLELDIKERISLIKDDHKKNGLPAHIRDEYKVAVDELKEEYSELFDLSKQLKELKEALKNSELTEEELANLQAEYDAKMEEFNALKDAFMTAINELKAEKKEMIDEVKEEIKEHARNRREEFANKIREHQERFELNKEFIENQIKNWRGEHD